MDPYDRALLLLGAKRHALLDLDEVRQYGRDSHGDDDYVSLYGLRPAEWFARGVRILGRTAVECTRDALGDRIGADVAAVVRRSAPRARLVLDAFAGSGNTLYWMLRHLPGAAGVAFEAEPEVFRLTARNLAVLGMPLDMRNVDFDTGLPQLRVPRETLLIAFIAPPWGRALDPALGLDLAATEPPVGEIVERLVQALPDVPLLCAVQVHERLQTASAAALRARFDWSAQQVYDIDRAGTNHGLILGTRGWIPGPA